MRPLIIGVTGGSGAGKTTIIEALLHKIDSEQITHIQQDSYYKDQSHLPLAERYQVNYDHPDSLDMDLMKMQIKRLGKGEGVDIPIFDYVPCVRLDETQHLEPHPIIIIDGILLLHDAAFRDLLDVAIFVEAPADVRLMRRLERDVKRGMKASDILAQYERHVRPMYEQFIAPYRDRADLIIPNVQQHEAAVALLANALRYILRS